MSTLEPLGMNRRRTAMAGWRRRSTLIRGLRRGLPIVILLTVLGLVAAVIAAAVMGRMDDDRTADSGVTLGRPRFYGRDGSGRAYVLSAQSAVRPPGQASRIVLTAPVITLGSGGERAVRVTAADGDYDETTKVLTLRRDVRMADAGGFSFATEEAVIDTQSNAVRGSRPVTGEGPAGRIAADSFAVYDQGARITFNGRVRARLVRGGETSTGPTGTGAAR